jgi:hypothetical protein
MLLDYVVGAGGFNVKAMLLRLLLSVYYCSLAVSFFRLFYIFVMFYALCFCYMPTGCKIKRNFQALGANLWPRDSASWARDGVYLQSPSPLQRRVLQTHYTTHLHIHHTALREFLLDPASEYNPATTQRRMRQRDRLPQ